MMDSFSWTFAHPFLTAFLVISLSILYLILLWTYRIFLRPQLSPLRNVPGPESAHRLWGNMEEFSMKEPGQAHTEWTEKFGGAVRYRGLLGQDLLLLSDPTAMTYLLTNDPYGCYEKPAELRGDLLTHLGKGLIFAEGEDHLHQRRMLTPAFSHGNVKAMLPNFYELSNQLRDIWTKRIEGEETDMSAWYYQRDLDDFKATKEDGEVVIEVADWITRLTLDAIGKTGFGYDFKSLDRNEDVLASAFTTLFAPRVSTTKLPPQVMLIHQIIGTFLHSLPSMSWLKHLPDPRLQAILKACEDMEHESRKIITAKREEVKRDGIASLKGKKDLISLLIAAEGPDSKFSMSSEELRGQLNSFLFAGHDTIAGTVAWVLLALSSDPTRQERLRKEIRTARMKAIDEGREELDHEELLSLEYLDAVVRESLRLEPALTATPRVAIKDDLIPITTPTASSMDPSKTISHIPIKKGQTIWLGVYAVNRNKDVFGQDANEFRPERWLDEEKKIESKMGVYSGLMTFLAGPRSCPGYKFAVLEIKAVLSVLIDTFEFAPRNARTEIERGTQVITRPFVKGEVHLGTRMPLRIRLAKAGIEED